MAVLKLLVVEDDAATLELMTEVFTSLKAEVHGIDDSEKAAAVVNKERFDGIFLDLEMPHLNGFDLARLIRKSSWNKSTPIVIVTGRDDRQTMQNAFATGATFFIQKPVDRQKLTVLFRTVSGGMVENRRKSVRVPIKADVVCTVGSKTMRGSSWNLSQGGMQVEVSGLRTNDKVGLSFRLPVSGEALDPSGTVVWGDQQRQGIQFTSVSPQNLQTIRKFIAQNEEPEQQRN